MNNGNQKQNNNNKNNKEYQDLRGSPIREKTTAGDEHRTIHYTKEYRIDLRRLIRDYNSQNLSHKTRKKRTRIHKVFLLLVS